MIQSPYVVVPTVAEVIAFLGWTDSPTNRAKVSPHLEHVSALAKAYTRGRGYNADNGDVVPAIKAVILSATARSVSNPAQAYKVVAGTVEATPSRFEGWTALERVTLDRYRERVA